MLILATKIYWMKKNVFPVTVVFLFVTTSWAYKTAVIGEKEQTNEKNNIAHTGKIINRDTILFPGETHFANVQQLTFGGDNAEAYFSFDGKSLVFQKTNPKEGIACDQIWMGKIPTQPGEKFAPKLLSSGKAIKRACFAISRLAFAERKPGSIFS
jgi:hypothetical protein